MTHFLDYIKRQRRRGFSPLILFVGRQRSGKTALALRMAFEINNDFDFKTDMFFKIEDFATAFDKHNKKVFIIDEAGITLDPYEHMSVTQRVYSHIVQSQAYKQNIIFLVLPFASEIGRTHRKHIDAIVEVIGRGMYKLYATSRWYSDLSYKPPRLRHIETVVGVPLPPKHIWNVYKEEGQTNYKKSIMDLQQSILDQKKRGKKKVIVESLI